MTEKYRRTKITEDNIAYVHRNLLESEYAELVDRRRGQIAIAFVLGAWAGTVATLLVTLWWLP